jgi:hypothetical protein
MIETKAFRTSIRIYSLLKNKRLSVNIKLTLHKALIRTIMTCLPHRGICGACKTEFSALLAVFQGAHRFTICTWLSNFHYMHDYITKLCGQQAQPCKIKKMQIFAILDKAKPDTENVRGLNMDAVRRMTVQVTRLLLRCETLRIGHDLLY